MKVLDYEGLKQVIDKIKIFIDKKADKIALEKIGLEITELEKRTAADLESRLKQLENAFYENITGNPFTITFKNLDGLTITNGIFNENKARLEC